MGHRPTLPDPMIYFSADQVDSTSLTIYRGMTLNQWTTRQGTARKGTERVAQFHAGDRDIHAGDTDVYVASCARNALTFTAIDSSRNRHSWLSFSMDRNVATFFALNQLDESDPDGGVVIETNLSALRELGVAYAQNDVRVPWEQEVSVDLFEHPLFPEPAIVQVHPVRYADLWRAASALQSHWGGTGKYTRHAYSF